MKYQVGDEIVVLHSHEEGRVIEIINDKMVMIEVRGVKFPAYMDQIDFPYFLRFTKQLKKEKPPPPKLHIDQIPKEKPQPSKSRVADGVWLSFLPQFGLDDFNDEVVESLKIYLINHSPHDLRFEYRQMAKQTEQFGLVNEVLSFHDFYLHDLPFAALNDGLSFAFDFSLKTAQKGLAEHFEAPFKPKPKQFFQQIEQAKENGEPSIRHRLFEHYPEQATTPSFSLDALVNKGFKVYAAKDIRQHLPPARTVIDLHAEKILDNPDHWDPAEILDAQLKELEKWVDIAVAHRQPELTVIHGVGAGVLREEVHAYLKTKKGVKNFVHQYDPRFGHGATQVFFHF